MLKDQTIFILGATKFDGVYESTSYNTAKFLAKENDVYYVDFPLTWRDYYSKYQKTAVETRKSYYSGHSNGIITIPGSRLKIIILPLLMSVNFFPEGRLYRYLLAFNESKIAKRLNFFIKEEGIKDFVFINSFNFHYPNIGQLIGAKLSVYHCVDPLIIDYDKKHGFESELILLQKSDLVICTSKQLFREKVNFNNNTFFIPNAADLTLSSKALSDELEVHKSLEKIPYPIVGYFGHIERRMDYNLLKEVAKINPHISFVFVGPVSEEFIPIGFRDIPNVYFTGSVLYSEMPSVLKGFKIAMIPFKKDDVSSTIFPLKLFEYLGAGKPVIATDFNPDLEEFTGNAVSYCADSDSFTAAVSFYLTNDTIELRSERLLIAKANTWEIRLGQLSELINDFYKLK